MTTIDLERQFDDEIPYQPQSELLEPILVDPLVAVREKTKKEIRLIIKPYLGELTGLDEVRGKTEWFYRLFYLYTECSMDNDLVAMYTYVCTHNPIIIAKNARIREIFYKILGTDDLLTKKITALVFVGIEPDIADHIYTMTKDCLENGCGGVNEDPYGYDMSKGATLFLNKTRRLLIQLPTIIGELGAQHFSNPNYNQFNVRRRLTYMLERCMDIYQTGGFTPIPHGGGNN